jgi:hypothetical protein
MHVSLPRIYPPKAREIKVRSIGRYVDYFCGGWEFLFHFSRRKGKCPAIKSAMTLIVNTK